MEADIILEGFMKANEYGVRYMTIIADGDSSTYARILEEVPVWDIHVKKGRVCKPCVQMPSGPSWKTSGC